MSRSRGALLGAAFLMATSAIGPGFLTQTAVFTEQLTASFGFVILASLLLSVAAQLNVWRVLVVAEKRAQDVANLVLPGLGHALAFLIVLGGLAFNIGNVAGAGLGLNVLIGVTTEQGAVVSGAIAIAVFLVKEAGRAMDRLVQLMGLVMLGLTLYVALTSRPPIGEALVRTVAPAQLDALAIVTLVGGTVGGYITYSGGHRLLDGGIRGLEAIPTATRGAITGIGVAALMRVLLFLAALGVVSRAGALDAANPPASVFQLAAGAVGYKLFGVVMWAAAITSVVGSSYTSVSFVRTLSTVVERYQKVAIVAFVAVSAVVFVAVGRPVKVLILVGALNGLILPVSLGVMLVAAYRRPIVGDYRHPGWLTVIGGIVVVSMGLLGGYTLVRDVPKLFGAYLPLMRHRYGSMV